MLSLTRVEPFGDTIRGALDLGRFSPEYLAKLEAGWPRTKIRLDAR